MPTRRAQKPKLQLLTESQKSYLRDRLRAHDDAVKLLNRKPILTDKRRMTLTDAGLPALLVEGVPHVNDDNVTILIDFVDQAWQQLENHVFNLFGIDNLRDTLAKK